MPCNKPWILAPSRVFVLTCNGDNLGREDLKQFAQKSSKVTIANNPALKIFLGSVQDQLRLSVYYTEKDSPGKPRCLTRALLKSQGAVKNKYFSQHLLPI